MSKFDFNQGLNFDPIDLLEMSISICLIREIKLLMKSGVDSLDVRISNNKVRIQITCEINVQDKIKKAIKNCYILQHVKLDHILTFVDSKEKQ